MGTVQGTELHRLRGLHGRAGGEEEGAAWLRGHWLDTDPRVTLLQDIALRLVVLYAA